MRRVNKKSSKLKRTYYLPHEIWEHNILPSLPVKSLLKFRSVCKSWRSVIDEPSFVSKHINLSKNNRDKKLLISLKDHKEFWSLAIYYCKTHRKVAEIMLMSKMYDLLGSCNGLLLVGDPTISSGLNNGLRLWNPSVRKSLRLPPCPLSSFYGAMVVSYVLGSDSSCNHHKVVAFYGGTGTELMVAVFRVGDDRWNVKTNPLKDPVDFFIDRAPAAVFSQGTVHFIKGVFCTGCGEKSDHLVSFDFDTETFTYAELPDACERQGTLRFLFLLGDILAVFSISSVSSRIWVRGKDKGKDPWIALYSGESSEQAFSFFRNYHGLKILYVQNDGGSFICGEKLYNIVSCKIQELRKHLSFRVCSEIYSESLLLLKEYGSQDLISFP